MYLGGGRPRHINAAAPYADKLARLMESGRWGRAYADTLRIAEPAALCALPVGGLRDIRKLYIYLNADAVVFLNDQPLRMRVTRQGFWELLADTPVHALAVRADVAPAWGKYVVFGD